MIGKPDLLARIVGWLIVVLLFLAVVQAARMLLAVWWLTR